MYDTKNKIVVKQNDDFALFCEMLDDDCNPISLQGAEIKSEIRDSRGNLIDTMDVGLVDVDLGKFTLLPTIDSLPLKQLFMDVLVIDSDSKRHTDALMIEVQRVVTR